jgi:hypothetical protein
MRIHVEDNSVGIDAAARDKHFRQGFTTKPGGSGIGLHSSANAALQLGGALVFHSDGPGQDAVFTLELPVAPAAVREYIGCYEVVDRARSRSGRQDARDLGRGRALAGARRPGPVRVARGGGADRDLFKVFHRLWAEAALHASCLAIALIAARLFQRSSSVRLPARLLLGWLFSVLFLRVSTERGLVFALSPWPPLLALFALYMLGPSPWLVFTGLTVAQALLAFFLHHRQGLADLDPHALGCRHLGRTHGRPAGTQSAAPVMRCAPVRSARPSGGCS